MQVPPASGNGEDGDFIVLTPRFLAIFSATEESDTCGASACSVPRALAMRSISVTKFSVVLIANR